MLLNLFDGTRCKPNVVSLTENVKKRERKKRKLQLNTCYTICILVWKAWTKSGIRINHPLRPPDNLDPFARLKTSSNVFFLSASSNAVCIVSAELHS